MVKTIVVYDSGTLQNAQINTGAAAFLSSMSADNGDAWRRAFKQHNQNFNGLVIRNNSALDLTIQLDGLTSRNYDLPATMTLRIERDEGIYFSDVQISNDSGTNLVLNLIKANVQILKDGA